MLEELLGSRTKARIVKFLSENPERLFSISEIARRSGVSKSQACIALKQLHIHILSSESIGKSIAYSFRPDTPFKRSLMDLLAQKTSMEAGQ